MNLDFIELSNIEINEFCRLDKSTSEKEFYNKKKIHSFTGLYYKEEDLFFALYPTESGPMMYYEGKEYPLYKSLSIHLDRTNDIRKFQIDEYKIFISYRTSKYIDFDVWSEEEDVDLFYKIYKNYQKDEFVHKFTKKFEGQE